MKFKWWGHSCFTITTDDGVKIVTDPYGNDFPYENVTDRAEIVTVSHDHFDHNGTDSVPGDPEIVATEKGIDYQGVKIRGVSSFHDDEKGSSRGQNIIFIIESGDKTVVHLGDLGHSLNEEQKEKLTAVDILLIPVGGHFTIDASQAYKIVEQLDPAVIFPMHYKTDKIDLPIKGITPFLENFAPNRVKDIAQSEIEITKLPENQTVYVLNYIE
ncbi:MAG: MBL fold metallo-hydrolase [Halanaerobiaceae bacterium]